MQAKENKKEKLNFEGKVGVEKVYVIVKPKGSREMLS
jgi:hypothetical protein